MDTTGFVNQLRSGGRAKFPPHANSLEYARKLDEQDPLRHLRDEYILPTKASLRKKHLNGVLPGRSAGPPWPTIFYFFYS